MIKRWESRAQASMEYLFIVAMAMVIIIPASLLFFDFSSGSEDRVVNSQVYLAGSSILVAVEQVFVMGTDSRVTIDVTLPDAFENATVYCATMVCELAIAYNTQSGVSEQVFFSDIPMVMGVDNCDPNCDLAMLSAGVTSLTFTSGGVNVSVS